MDISKNVYRTAVAPLIFQRRAQNGNVLKAMGASLISRNTAMAFRLASLVLLASKSSLVCSKSPTVVVDPPQSSFSLVPDALPLRKDQRPKYY